MMMPQMNHVIIALERATIIDDNVHQTKEGKIELIHVMIVVLFLEIIGVIEKMETIEKGGATEI